MTVTAKSHCFTNSYSSELAALPFCEIGGQSRIFVQYMKDPRSLSRYFPDAVASHTEVSARIPKVLEDYEVDRTVLCDALEKMNRESGCGEKTLDNIRLLRESDCVAVVSGQQAGLFSGPLFTMYKALSAIKLAKCLRDRGFKAVPVFWIATEDHDFQEVSSTSVINREGGLAKITVDPKGRKDGLPVGEVILDSSAVEALDQLFRELPHTEHTAELKAMMAEAWRPGTCFGQAFAKCLAGIFADHGLILLCPLNRELKKLAAPIYTRAIERSDAIVEALRERSSVLEADGYHAQVHVGDDYFPLFWQADDGTRNSLKRTDGGKFGTRDNSVAFSREQLLGAVSTEPWRFSPSVVLRSVVQDFLLPTVAYFGGAAEVAYFAQSGEVYRVLDRPVTPIIHRESFTVVEPRHRKTMTRYDLELKDLFGGIEKVFPKIVESHLNAEGAAVFSEAASQIEGELDRLGALLSGIDKSLEDNVAMRRRKIEYHLGAMKRKFHDAQARKDEATRIRIDSLFASLLPERNLQERTINVVYFLNRYGRSFIDWIYEAIDLDDKDHRIIYL